MIHEDMKWQDSNSWLTYFLPNLETKIALAAYFNLCIFYCFEEERVTLTSGAGRLA